MRGRESERDRESVCVVCDRDAASEDVSVCGTLVVYVSAMNCDLCVYYV